LVHERDRADAVASELAAARQEIERLAARTAQSSAAALEAKEALQVSRTEQQQASVRERERADTVARQLAAARGTIEALMARTAEMSAAVFGARDGSQVVEPEQQQAVVRERQQAHATVHAGELAAARKEIEDLTVRAAQAISAVLETREAPGQQQALVREREALTIASEQTPQTVQALSGTLLTGTALPQETRRQLEAPTASIAVRPKSAPLNTSVKSLPALHENSRARSDPPAAEISPASDDKLVQRAEILIKQGAISAARTVLQRALDAGNVYAAYLLAETYDPTMLASWKAHGTQGNRVKARELYTIAYEGGISMARQRVERTK
jgi:hypothetical protein